jgi:hypothetical protein
MNKCITGKMKKTSNKSFQIDRGERSGIDGEIFSGFLINQNLLYYNGKRDKRDWSVRLKVLTISTASKKL